MKEFLWFLAGANVFILKTAHSDQSKFSWVGATLLLTAITACFTGGLALFTVFHNGYSAAFAGLLWGLFILSIDSMIVATLGQSYDDSEDDKNLSGWPLVWQNIKKHAPLILRLVISLIIGLVIAKPLEFKIFEKEIKEERIRIKINECQYEQYQANRQRILQYRNDTTQITANKHTVDILNAKISCYGRAKAREIAGIGGVFTCSGNEYETSGRAGTGKDSTSAYFGLEKQIQDTRKEVKLLNDDIKTRTERSKKTIEYLANTGSECSVETVKKQIANTTPTILEAYVALGLLSSVDVAAQRDKSGNLQSDSSKIQTAENSNISNPLKTLNVSLENAILKAKNANQANWFITLLVILIELSPVLLKSMQNPEEYNRRLKDYIDDTKSVNFRYVDLINKYPFLATDIALSNAYKKNRKLYEDLVPELNRINELHAEANSHFNILTEQTRINEETSKEVNETVANSMKDKQIKVANKILDIWENKLNQKIDDDPDQFMGNTQNESSKSRGTKDESAAADDNSSEESDPNSFEQYNNRGPEPNGVQ